MGESQSADFGSPRSIKEMKTMKTLMTVLGLTLLLSVALPGQTPDSAARRRQQEPQRGFVDGNGDGIRDRAQQRQERARRRTDRFVDTNGDGISDGRECGLGFRRRTTTGDGTAKQTAQRGLKGRK